jgi:hypothetical protein
VPYLLDRLGCLGDYAVFKFGTGRWPVEILKKEVTLNKSALRMAQSFLVITSLGAGLFTTAAFAKETWSVSLHAAPPNFFNFLYKHDSSGSIFEPAGVWVSAGRGIAFGI